MAAPLSWKCAVLLYLHLELFPTCAGMLDRWVHKLVTAIAKG